MRTLPRSERQRFAEEFVRGNVKRGAAFLDEVKPYWAFDIDVEKLDITDCQSCTLGQLYGNYYDGLERLDFSPSEVDAEKHGFTLDFVAHAMCMTEPEWDHMWVQLTQAWKDEIIKRKEEVTGMQIGEEQPAIVVEPIDVPEEMPAPAKETPTPVTVPDKEKVPA